MNDDNRRIAKNTIYLYSRMIVMMLVTLYTSRIILEKLGVDDYGGNMEKLKRTFSTLLTSHIILALFIVFLAETGGTWFM